MNVLVDFRRLTARPARGLAQDDPDPVHGAVVSERDRGAARQRLSVELRRCHPAIDPLRVRDDDVASGGVIAIVDLEARPRAGDAGIEQERRSAQTNPRIHLAAMDAGPCARMVDRVEDGEQLARLVPLAQSCEVEDRPDPSVGVLATVLADAGLIPLDIAWVWITGRGGWIRTTDARCIRPLLSPLSYSPTTQRGYTGRGARGRTDPAKLPGQTRREAARPPRRASVSCSADGCGRRRRAG